MAQASKYQELYSKKFLKANINKPLSEIADMLGCDPSAVSRAYKRMNMSKAQAPNPKIADIPQLKDPKFLKDNIGRPASQIAKELGCGQTLVYKSYTKAGIERVKANQPKRLSIPQLEDREFLERNKHKSLRALAEELQCASSTVHRAYAALGVTKELPAAAPIKSHKSAKDWNNTAKNEARNTVLSTDRKFKSILMLPGDQCLDVRQMLEEGSISLDTHVTVVERDPDILKNIQKTFKGLGITNTLFLNEELVDVNLTRIYDFMYLDTCSELTLKLLSFLVKLTQLGNLADNGVVALGLARFRGASEVMSDFQKFMIRNNKSISEDFNPAGDPSDIMREQHNVIGTMLELVLGPCLKSLVYRSEGKSVGMHVFSFQSRKKNQGIISIIKFLMENGEPVPIITPGIKAAVKRKGLVVVDKLKTPPVSTVDKKSAYVQQVIDLKEAVDSLTRRVENLESSSTELVVVPPGAPDPDPLLPEGDEILDLFSPKPDKLPVLIRVDEDVIHWFKSKATEAGTNHLEDMAKVLNIFKTQWEDKNGR